jgi:hypothetical protein
VIPDNSGTSIGEPGYLYCVEHQAQMAYLEKSDREYQEVEQSWESITSSHLPASQDSLMAAEIKDRNAAQAHLGISTSPTLA